MSKERRWEKQIEHDEQLLHKNIERKEQQQRRQGHYFAELPAINMTYTRTTSCRNSMLQDSAFARDQHTHVSSLKASNLLQILRRWRAQSLKQTTLSGASMASRRSAARSHSCLSLGLTLAPLRCLSMQLHSDDEDEGQNGAKLLTAPSRGSPRQICGSRGQGSTLSTPRALSCPKVGTSPLSACTPFSSRHLDAQIRDDEEMECLQPTNEESTGSSKGSSPLKLNNLSRQLSTPKGYLAVYVGEEKKRFLVKASLVNHPLFGVLLEKAKEQFGFEQKGPLNIPCEIAFFEHVMLLVESDDSFYRNTDRATILLHLNNNSATTVV
ncbi:hypothetical protein GOP47_0005727 [Adiantum capillus-veneris]|uniref:Uncharacterized protein n=1 Tax=Adiantum capillus-veneris TaxID=13818 RepID=A0A9D4V5X5_ADICA|nr:hypothetical protein GOP47_0005727 [Adiantum capillus-veneris]